MDKPNFGYRRLRGLDEMEPPRRLAKPRRLPLAPILVSFLAGAGIVSAGSLALKHPRNTEGGLESVSGLMEFDCDIKGNISWTGQRIFHVQGQEGYAETRINPTSGERWFCSEDEARAAGWRKAGR
jgi:hypothetical protein